MRVVRDKTLFGEELDTFAITDLTAGDLRLIAHMARQGQAAFSGYQSTMLVRFINILECSADGIERWLGHKFVSGTVNAEAMFTHDDDGCKCDGKWWT